MEYKLFAWRPVTVTSGQKIWLTTYIQHRNLYDESTGRPPMGNLYFTWTETQQERVLRILKGK